MECCIRWNGLHNHPTSTQSTLFGMSRTAEWRKSSQQVLSICGNSFKTIGKAFQVKLVERMPRVCKAVIKAKSGYFEESKIYILICLTLSLVTTLFSMCYFIVLMSSLVLYNVENSQNKETLEWIGLSKLLTGTVHTLYLPQLLHTLAHRLMSV